MRTYLGHRLPGGFYGGIGAGSFGRRSQGGRPSTMVVVHVSGQQAVAIAAARRRTQLAVAKVLLAIFALGAALVYWYIALPVAILAFLYYIGTRNAHP